MGKEEKKKNSEKAIRGSFPHGFLSSPVMPVIMVYAAKLAGTTDS